jgi:hypothetical protein
MGEGTIPYTTDAVPFTPLVGWADPLSLCGLHHVT